VAVVCHPLRDTIATGEINAAEVAHQPLDFADEIAGLALGYLTGHPAALKRKANESSLSCVRAQWPIRPRDE